MAMLNNVVRTFEFNSDLDLYNKIDDFTSHQIGKGQMCIRVRSINIIDGNHALVYMEPDFSVIQVRFYQNGKLYQFEDVPCNDKFMSCSELSLIDSLGELNIEGKVYDVDTIEHCIDNFGVSYAKINLK